MKIGDRVQLKFLHRPKGTIIGMEDGTVMNGVVLVSPSFIVRWDDGEMGQVAEYDLLLIAEDFFTTNPEQI